MISRRGRDSSKMRVMTEVIEGQRTFSVDEYHRMAEAGVFAPDERIELIRGVIREMSPKGRKHRVAVALANHLFVRRLAGRAVVQVQDPLSLPGTRSEPEPDVVVTSSPDPRDVGTERSRPLLVIEVADTSLGFDREVKGRLYAEAGISEYWLVNLVDDVLEVYRDPEKGSYSTRRILSPSDKVAPLSFPDLEIEVRDLIP
jgi:Uma2 family endonuclease